MWGMKIRVASALLRSASNQRDPPVTGAIVASEKPSSFHGEATLFVGQISCPVNKSSLHGTKDEKGVTPIIILHSLMLVVGIDFKRHLPISIHQLQVP